MMILVSGVPQADLRAAAELLSTTSTLVSTALQGVYQSMQATAAELWNMDMDQIRHWSPPAHAMQIWRYAEQGSIKLFWIDEALRVLCDKVEKVSKRQLSWLLTRMKAAAPQALIVA